MIIGEQYLQGPYPGYIPMDGSFDNFSARRKKKKREGGGFHPLRNRKKKIGHRNRNQRKHNFGLFHRRQNLPDNSNVDNASQDTPDSPDVGPVPTDDSDHLPPDVKTDPDPANSAAANATPNTEANPEVKPEPPAEPPADNGEANSNFDETPADNKPGDTKTDPGKDTGKDKAGTENTTKEHKAKKSEPSGFEMAFGFVCISITAAIAIYAAVAAGKVKKEFMYNPLHR